jgi:hypothetical protein
MTTEMTTQTRRVAALSIVAQVMRQEYFPAAKLEAATKFGDVTRALVAMQNSAIGSLQDCRKDLRAEADESRRVVRVLRMRLNTSHDEVAVWLGMAPANGLPTLLHARRVESCLRWPLAPTTDEYIRLLNRVPDPGPERLLQYGADVSVTLADGRTPLMAAAAWGMSEYLRALLDGGAPIDARDAEGCTALMHAVKHDRTPAVRLLLERKADINAETNDGRDVTDCHIGKEMRDLFLSILVKDVILLAATSNSG